MKIVALSDSPIQSGFGRISNEVFNRLAFRGHQVHVVSLLWDGVMIDKTDWYSNKQHNYLFQISGCAGRDIYSYIANITNLAQPDVVMSVQDFPYAQSIYYNCRIDWSRRAFALITPIDGEPIYEDWLRLVDDADGSMVISQFGVDAMKRAGKTVSLCPPGIDHNYFKPATEQERLVLLEKAGLPANAFVVGMMAMNQGRKDIPHTLDGFKQFSVDKPNAYLLLDMDKVNPAGWNIPSLMKTKDIPESKVLFREDLSNKSIRELRERFALLSVHSVLSHREGFGLPLVESQAMMIPTVAMDWCSGTEICGNGQGYLVGRKEQPRNSTWGNALDYDPDVEQFVQVLNTVYTQPIQAKAIAERGYQWAIQRTWDKAADNVEEMLRGIEEKLSARRKRNSASVQPAPASLAVVRDVPGAQADPIEGSNSDGRPLDGVRPDAVGVSAISGSEEREESGVRCKRKQGRKPSDGEISLLRE